MTRVKRAIICSTSNFATDYRIHKLRETLVSMGYEVELLGRRHPKEERVESEGVRYMRLLTWHSAIFYAEFNVRLMWRLLWGKRVDLVVSIDLDTLLGCQMAARMRGERLLWDSHELFPEVPEIANKPRVKKVWWWVQDVCMRRLRKGDVTMTVCKTIADILGERYGREFLVVRNVPMGTRKVCEKKREGAFTLLYQGAVNVGRGIEETIGALGMLEGVRLVIVGGGDVMDEVKALVKEKGVEDRVDIVGRVPFTALPEYMADADMGLALFKDMSLNYRYALPNRVFDFIHARLPILGSKLPEIERIVEGEDVGVCIETLTAESIAEAVRRVISEPELLKKWKENMGRVAEVYTWERDSEKFIKALKQGEDSK